MTKLLDILFLCLHVIIILFNLFGWIWIRTRKVHFWLMLATLFSWLVLGLKYGLGYCFLTDWHWSVKRQLGETDLPASFVKYFLDKYTFFDISAATVDLVTGISFGIVVLISAYLHFIYPRLGKGNQKMNVK
jgi:hypothetical protein